MNDDVEPAYQGDPSTGRPTEGSAHEHHLWHEDRVRALAADRSDAVTFVCGGSRNVARFLDVFDGVLVLDVVDEILRRTGPSEHAGIT